MVGVRDGKPIFLQDVATVRDGPLPASRYVWHGVAGKDGGEYPAVTIAVTKKPGENAIDVANAVMRRVEMLRNTVIPHDIEVAETRNYGATANDKAQKLIQKLLFATASVVALVFLALGTARSRHRRQRGDPDAGGDAVRLVGVGVHAEPRLAVRA